MLKINTISKKLEEKDCVEAVFVAGSYGRGDQSQNSDYDLVIILRENKEQIRSVYTWIDNVFADIFIFDHTDLERLQGTPAILANSLDGMLATWLEKGHIIFDKSGLLSTLKETRSHFKLAIPDQEKRDAWQKINYALIANTRYFHAVDDETYREALDLRLLYSVVELIGAYFTLRNIPWRGEKLAITHIREHAKDLFFSYQQFQHATTVSERFGHYEAMVGHVLTEEFKLWTKDTIVIVKKEGTQESTSVNFWNSLIT
ncbi:nucleotidyltransferase domain-containing protein [Patescibacteria group bacterium]|nr:nucleotidyltransferase domain-containing protein [Patescibacteria group bacterium]